MKNIMKYTVFTSLTALLILAATISVSSAATAPANPLKACVLKRAHGPVIIVHAADLRNCIRLADEIGAEVIGFGEVVTY